MTVRVRIAPSPTGNLHIGTARTAVFNWLFARHHGGKFILRIEDTDQERSRPEYTENILEGLRWLGLNWDEGPFFQSQRLDMYKQAVQKLLDQGLAYRCYTTSAELEALRSEQQARKQAPRYDNRHRHLTPEQEAAFQAEGRSFVIRFKIEDDREIVWTDLVRGKMTWKGSDLGGDMVIARATEGGIGQPLYNFAVVVDDMDMQITHVIRGEDHIANTAKQILLYEAFGVKPPEFGHTPLILNRDGSKLSKRDGATSVSEFQQLGFTPAAIANYMMLLGWSPPDTTQEIFSLAEAAQIFSFDRVNKAGAKFDWDKLDWINSQYIHAMPVTDLTNILIPYMEAAGQKIDEKHTHEWLEELVGLIGASLKRLPEAVEIAQPFFCDKITYSSEAETQLASEDAKNILKAVIEALNNGEALTPESANSLIKQVMKTNNLKKGAVMKTIRAALTGEVHGPDLIQSWLLLHQIDLDQPRFAAALG